MRSNGAYRDPTADKAIGKVIKEQKKKVAVTDYRDEPAAPKRRIVPSWNEKLNNIKGK
jgi:hypothetical protein